MLTYAQWVKAHEKKLAGVSKTKRRERYHQYQVSSAEEIPRTDLGVKRPRGPSSMSPARVTDALKKELRGHAAVLGAIDLEHESLLRSTPDDLVRFVTTDVVPVFADNQGNAAIFVKGGIDKVFAASGPMSNGDSVTSATAGSDLPDLYIGVGADRFALPAHDPRLPGELPTWTNKDGYPDPVMVANLRTTRESGAIRKRFTAVAFQTGTIEIDYTMNDFEKQGSVVVAPWPGAANVPSSTNMLLSMRPDDGITNDLNDSVGPTFDQISTLRGAERRAVRDGVFTARLTPQTTRQMKELRPTNYTPAITTAAAVFQNQRGSSIPTSMGDCNDVVRPAACDTDADQFRSKVDALWGLNRGVTPCNSGQPSNTPVYAANHTLTFAPSQTTDGATQAAGADELASMMNSYTNTSMGSGDAAVIIFFSGCKASTVANGAPTEMFKVADVTIRQVFLGQLATRSFSVGHARARLNHSYTRRQVQKLVMQHVPVVSPGVGPAATSHGIANTVKSIIADVGDVAVTAAAAAPAIVEALGVLGAIFM